MQIYCCAGVGCFLLRQAEHVRSNWAPLFPNMVEVALLDEAAEGLVHSASTKYARSFQSEGFTVGRCSRTKTLRHAYGCDWRARSGRRAVWLLVKCSHGALPCGPTQAEIAQ